MSCACRQQLQNRPAGAAPGSGETGAGETGAVPGRPRGEHSWAEALGPEGGLGTATEEGTVDGWTGGRADGGRADGGRALGTPWGLDAEVTQEGRKERPSSIRFLKLFLE